MASLLKEGAPGIADTKTIPPAFLSADDVTLVPTNPQLAEGVSLVTSLTSSGICHSGARRYWLQA